MTSKKEKILIQRGDLLFCDCCGGAWKIGQAEDHAEGCEWWPGLPAQEHVDSAAVKVREATRVFREENGQTVGAFGLFKTPPNPIPVVPIYGWVCSRCQRVFAPHISECPHCQPGACGDSRLEREKG